MYFKKYMYSCGKFVRITAHYNLWGQTLTFGDKLWFSKSGISMTRIVVFIRSRIFLMKAYYHKFWFFLNRISHLETHAIMYGVGKIHRALISFLHFELECLNSTLFCADFRTWFRVTWDEWLSYIFFTAEKFIKK